MAAENEFIAGGAHRGTATPPPLPGGTVVAPSYDTPSYDSGFPSVPATEPSGYAMYETIGNPGSLPAAAPPPAAPPSTAAAPVQDGERGILANGDLSEYFLRLTEHVLASDIQQGRPAQHNAAAAPSINPLREGTLRVTLVQAKLAKNYGLGRMDPFCKLTCGNYAITSSVVPNGAKEPRWNQVMDVPVQAGLGSCRVEIYDMGTFSDRLIAWGSIDIAARYDGAPVEQWLHLSGKQGQDKEGVLLVRLHFQESYVHSQVSYGHPPPGHMVMHGQPMMAPPGFHPQYPPTAVGVPPGYGVPVAQQPQVYQATSEDIGQLRSMFPDLDDEIIGSVLQANAGNKESSINSLLSMGPR